MKTFFDPEATETLEEIHLSPEESHHAVKVLRTTAGEKVAVLNGKGLRLQGPVVKADAKKCTISIHDIQRQAPSQGAIHIALALIKKRDRIEWFVEKAVELGAAAITIFESEHTEKGRLDMDRIHKIAISALKQSGNLWLPDIRGVLKFKEMLAIQAYEQKFIAYCPTGEEQLLKKQYTRHGSATVLIGPEGDFSPKEVEEAMRHDFRSVSLGPLRLRAETAALAALMTLQVINQ